MIGMHNLRPEKTWPLLTRSDYDSGERPPTTSPGFQGDLK
jgi:hypothetical protein